VRSHFLELIQEFLCRSPLNIVNFMDLVDLIVAWKERKEGKHLEENASDSPNIHFVVIVAIGE